MTSRPLLSKPRVTDLSQQLLQASIDEAVIEALVASSASVFLKRGESLKPSYDNALILSVLCGCLVEYHLLMDGQEHISSIRMQGDTMISMPKSMDTSRHNAVRYSCLFDSEIITIPEKIIQEQMSHSPKLAEFILSCAGQYLFATRELALFRSSLEKSQLIALQLVQLCQGLGQCELPMTAEELSQITETKQHDCEHYLKEMQQKGLIATCDDTISVIDINKLIANTSPEALARFSRNA